MILSKQGKLEICSREGFCLRPYFDSVGVITIGFGSTKTEIPNLANWDKSAYPPIQELIDIYIDSLKDYEEGVNNSLNVDVNQAQFDALVSFCYNVGIGGEAHSTLIKEINSKNSNLNDIYNAFLMWNKPPEILGRRKSEANLYCHGIYTGSYILQTDTDGKGHELMSTARNVDFSQYF